MKQFIYSIIFLISINISFSQTKELVLKKSFETNDLTTLNIDVDNVTIQFKESDDSKIRLDYSIIFKNNSDELIYKVSKGIKAKVSKNKNVINLDVKNSMYLGELHNLDVDINVYTELISDYFKKYKENKFPHKTKDFLLKEIDFSLGTDMHDYIKAFKKKYPNKNLGEGSKRFEQKFIINVPKNLKIKIKSLHSRITFNYNINKPIKVSAFKTYFKFKKINNNENEFNLNMGVFQTDRIIGGNYILKDVNKVLIGSISNAKLSTETSKIQIGEIGKDVEFNDFNSKLYFYNFNKNFETFELKGDYSKLYFYNKKNTVSLTAYGNTTAFVIDKQKASFKPSKDGKKFKMLEKKVKNKENYFGHINLNITHGIIEIKPQEKEH